MGFLKKIARIALSAFVPFPLLAWLGNKFIPYEVHPAAHENVFVFYDLKVFFSHTMPLLFMAALLMQTIVVVPLWDKASNKSGRYKLNALLIAAATVLIASSALSFIIWDSSIGYIALIHSALTLISTQVIYWIFSLLTLYLIDIIFVKKSAGLPEAEDK